MVSSIKKLIKTNKNIFTLITGTSLSQIIPIAISPFLTRLYTPAEFGVFAMYLSLVSILSVLVTFRYELAIVLPSDEENAKIIVELSLCLAAIVSVIILFSVIFVNSCLNLIYDDEMTKLLFYILPISLFSIGAYQSFYYWLNRHCEYSTMAKSRVVSSVTMALSQILLSYYANLSYLSLIIGVVIGQISSLIYIYIYSESFKKFNFKINIKKMRLVAKRYVDFPKYLMIGHIFNSSASNGIVLFLNNFFTSVVSGYYLLIQRVVGAPLSLIGSAISDVFRQQASIAYSKRGECKKEYISVLLKLSYLSILPFLAFFIIAPDIFELIFGEQWRIAGDYARILVPMFLLQFITNPLSIMFIIAEKQKLDLIWQTILVISTTLALLGGLFLGTVESLLILFSLSYTVMYIINGYMTYCFSASKEPWLIK